LTPLNYFDHDVSIESTNAVLLKNPEKPGNPFTYDDYGVKPAHCLPEHPSPFEYHPAKMFDLDGRPAPASSIEDMRKASELYHRIKLEL
jgi:primary-amine oxidase